MLGEVFTIFGAILILAGLNAESKLLKIPGPLSAQQQVGYLLTGTAIALSPIWAPALRDAWTDAGGPQAEAPVSRAATPVLLPQHAEVVAHRRRSARRRAPAGRPPDPYIDVGYRCRVPSSVAADFATLCPWTQRE